MCTPIVCASFARQWLVQGPCEQSVAHKGYIRSNPKWAGNHGHKKRTTPTKQVAPRPHPSRCFAAPQWEPRQLLTPNYKVLLTLYRNPIWRVQRVYGVVSTLQVYSVWLKEAHGCNWVPVYISDSIPGRHDGCSVEYVSGACRAVHRKPVSFSLECSLRTFPILFAGHNTVSDTSDLVLQKDAINAETGGPPATARAATHPILPCVLQDGMHLCKEG